MRCAGRWLTLWCSTSRWQSLGIAGRFMMERRACTQLTHCLWHLQGWAGKKYWQVQTHNISALLFSSAAWMQTMCALYIHTKLTETCCTVLVWNFWNKLSQIFIIHQVWREECDSSVGYSLTRISKQLAFILSQDKRTTPSADLGNKTFQVLIINPDLSLLISLKAFLK